MKLLTKEEEQAHYNYLVKGGISGGLVGLAAGGLGVWGASRRFSAFSRLTIPFRTFLVASSGSFAAILSADRFSRSFEASQHPDVEYTYKQQAILQQLEAKKDSTMTRTERWMEWAQQNKYSIVAGSWVVSIAVAFALVSRNRYLSGQQKIVQARVYAQGLTLAVVIASLALETHERTSDPTTPQSEEDLMKNQWKDMVDAAEGRMKERGESVKA